MLDEFNRNGKVCVVRIPKGTNLPACTSTVSEQFSKKIPGQYLEGGGKQAAIDKFFGSEIEAAANALRAAGGGKKTLASGIVVEVRDSGWSKINGRIGYGQTVIPGASTVERLGITETQTKIGIAASQQTASRISTNTVAVTLRTALWAERYRLEQHQPRHRQCAGIRSLRHLGPRVPGGASSRSKDQCLFGFKMILLVEVSVTPFPRLICKTWKS